MSEEISLKLFYNYGRLTMQKIWGSSRIIAVCIDHDNSFVTDGKKFFCRNCGRDLSFNSRLRGWCSGKCEMEFFNRYNFTWRDFVAKVYKRDNGKCRMCGTDLAGKKFVCDHIIPLFKGGRDWWEDPAMTNFQMLCEDCNHVKTAFDLRKPKKAKEKVKVQEFQRQLGLSVNLNRMLTDFLEVSEE